MFDLFYSCEWHSFCVKRMINQGLGLGIVGRLGLGLELVVRHYGPIAVLMLMSFRWCELDDICGSVYFKYLKVATH